MASERSMEVDVAVAAVRCSASQTAAYFGGSVVLGSEAAEKMGYWSESECLEVDFGSFVEV